MATSLLPLWPGWHRMPPPITVRWSRDAWEALCPLGCVGWKPWPWEPEPPTWDDVPDFLRSLPKSVPLTSPGLPWDVFEGYMRQLEAGAPFLPPPAPPSL